MLGIVLRRNPGEAHTVIEGKARGYFPRVLHIELQLVVSELAKRACGGLAESIKATQQCAGKSIALLAVAAARARCSASGRRAEIKHAVYVAPGDLVFSAPLIENAALMVCLPRTLVTLSFRLMVV